MFTLELTSGIGLLALAAWALSEFWWPPLRDAVRDEVSRHLWNWRKLRAESPGRWDRAMRHWRGVKGERRTSAILAGLALIGSGWLAWIFLRAAPAAKPPEIFSVVLVAIMIGTFVAAVGAVIFAGEVIAWVWRGFWWNPSPPVLPSANPMNRVGEAAPLGEARFARAGEVDAALAASGRPDFQPPKFRD